MFEIGKKYKVRGLDEDCFPIWAHCLLIKLTNERQGYDCVIETQGARGRKGVRMFCNLKELHPA